MISTSQHELRLVDRQAPQLIGQLLARPGSVLIGELRYDASRVPPSWLAQQLRRAEPTSGDQLPAFAQWCVLASPTEPAQLQATYWQERLRPWNTQRLIVLLLGLPPNQSGWRGWLFEAGLILPLMGFKILMPGMPSAGSEEPSVMSQEQWSRTVDSVGEKAFHKLETSSVAIHGASRLGSQMAFQLASVGVRRIVLVDPDELEEHNLVGMVGVTNSQLGQNKANALAQSLIAFRPDLAVTAIEKNALDRSVQLRNVDLIVSTVDQDAPRLWAARWAKEHGVIHLDIGTGITQEAEGRLIAADVRFLVPGQGCCCCVGGLGDLDQAIYEVNAPPRSAPRRPAEQWNARGRLGSLAHWNALSAAHGVQLWVDFLNGDLAGSSWQRLRWIPGRGLEVASGLVTAAENCKICRE